MRTYLGTLLMSTGVGCFVLGLESDRFGLYLAGLGLFFAGFYLIPDHD